MKIEWYQALAAVAAVALGTAIGIQRSIRQVTERLQLHEWFMVKANVITTDTYEHLLEDNFDEARKSLLERLKGD